jgi:histidinol-phosphate/aromatic aminotransferase/cobyric acid decarboxylase-like protein
MITRRGFAGLVAAGFTEFAFAQRSAVDSMNVQAPKGTVWLNANEFPEGPPAAALDAIARAAKESNRYHFTEYPAIYQSIASIEGLKGDQVLVGAGSTEALHCAV